MTLTEAITKLKNLGYTDPHHSETDAYRSLIVASDAEGPHIFRLVRGKLTKRKVNSSHSVGWEEIK